MRILNFLNESRGNRYLAHKTPHLTWNCQLTVKTREVWEKWRASVYGKAHNYELIFDVPKVDDTLFRIYCMCVRVILHKAVPGASPNRGETCG